jgi:hypothetical protein
VCCGVIRAVCFGVSSRSYVLMCHFVCCGVIRLQCANAVVSSGSYVLWCHQGPVFCGVIRVMCVVVLSGLCVL